MKTLKLSIVLFTFLLSNNVLAQKLRESEIPAIVIKNFQSKYPNAIVDEWEWKAAKSAYEVEFTMKNNEYKSYFNKAGEWLITKREIDKKEIPKAVLRSLLKTEYANWKIDDIEEQSTPEYRKIYEIKLETANRKVLLYFLPNGTKIENR
ncbi:MAG: PepSY-like domain-containing protein [Chitinophagaceae bacterium]|nr:PepSY-like domain-containing protein [Chitinophagaceae bacterium]MCW5905375.1 PepSY-like domain-containing protein [Chitinophagaceae bacterium]